jgi:hypothetical protein
MQAGDATAPVQTETDPAVPIKPNHRPDTTYRVKGIPLHLAKDATVDLLERTLHCVEESSPILKSLAIAIEGKYQHATICFNTLPPSLMSQKLPHSFRVDDTNSITVDTDFLGMTVLKSCDEEQHSVK